MVEYVVVVEFSRNGVTFKIGDKVNFLNLMAKGQYLLSKATYTGQRPQVCLTEEEKESLVREGHVKLPSQIGA